MVAGFAAAFAGAAFEEAAFAGAAFEAAFEVAFAGAAFFEALAGAFISVVSPHMGIVNVCFELQATRKRSTSPPSARSHLGLRPRPVQINDRSVGWRYFTWIPGLAARSRAWPNRSSI